MAVDQTIIDNLVKQILASSDTSKWQGEGFGGAEANAKAMAKLLADAGITDVKQFGKVDKYEPVEVTGYTLNGKTVQNPSKGVFYEEVPQYDSEGGIQGSIRRNLSPQEIAQVTPQYGIVETDADGGRVVKPVSKVIEKDGQLVGVTGTTFGNKATGQALQSGGGRWQRQGGEDLFGGTGEGKGNTAFRVQLDAQGNPVFSTTAGSSSDISNAMKTAALGAGLYFGLSALGGSGGLFGGAESLGGTESLLGGSTGGGTGLLTGGAEATVTGMGTGTGLTAGGSGLGLNAAGTAGLGTQGLGAGLTTGTGLTGTGVLSGSGLGTSLLSAGTGTAAGLTGTGILAGSELGTGLLGTTGTGALTGTGILSGSDLGTTLLGTGSGTAATVGGVTGLSNVANLGTDALTTGVTGGTTGVTGGTGGTTGGTTGTTGGTTGTTGGTAGGTGLLSGLTPEQLSRAISGALTTTGGLLQQQTSREAAQAAQARIDAETAAAKQAAQFRPIGTTTRFGTSQFTYDPVTGQMVSSGYQLTPEAKAQQDRLMALSNAGLTQAEQAQAQFAPLQTGAQSLFSLGNQYLAQSPEEVAQRYISQQMNLLQPSRETELANLQNKLYQQGRSGLAVSQGGNLGATTPELQALYNARAQQDAVLAAQAQQAGQQQVAFGAGLLGTGAQTMGQYYGGQQAAYAPYTTALGQVQNLEAQAQQPYNMSLALAQQQTNAGVNAGRLGLTGAQLSTNLATGPAMTNNPYATVLSGLGDPNSLVSQGITNAVRSIWNT